MRDKGKKRGDTKENLGEGIQRNLEGEDKEKDGGGGGVDKVVGGRTFLV